MTDIGYLIVIPAEPGWFPGTKSFQQEGCIGHPVWVSAAGVGELLTRPGLVTRCVLHLPPDLWDGQMELPDSIAQQFREEAGHDMTPELIEQMKEYYKRFQQGQ